MAKSHLQYPLTRWRQVCGHWVFQRPLQGQHAPPKVVSSWWFQPIRTMFIVCMYVPMIAYDSYLGSSSQVETSNQQPLLLFEFIVLLNETDKANTICTTWRMDSILQSLSDATGRSILLMLLYRRRSHRRRRRPSGHSTCPCTGCTSGAAIAHTRLNDDLHTWTLRPTLVLSPYQLLIKACIMIIMCVCTCILFIYLLIYSFIYSSM